MEPLFSPCTRLHDILERQGRLGAFRGHNPEPFQEINLDVSTEELLSAESAFTFADFHAMLENRNAIVWLTPHAAVTRESGLVANAWDQLDESYCFSFSADSKVIYAFARTIEHLLEICDVVVRLLAVSVVHSVHLHKWSYPDLFINAPTLEYMMEQCQSLKVLSLNNVKIDENHCRVLGDYSRPGLEIELEGCHFTSAGTSALAEILGRNQGPTKLGRCSIDNVVLAEGLRGNSRLKSLRPLFSNISEVRNRQVLAYTRALRENLGVVGLNLSDCFLSDKVWGAICDSLESHPTIAVLDLRWWTLMDPAITPAVVLKFQTQALVGMLKVNTAIHTIRLDPRHSQHELFRESVIPYLETTRLRSRLLAIQRTRPITYRAKVFGRALLAVRTDPNRFWMLLSENAEVVFA